SLHCPGLTGSWPFGGRVGAAIEAVRGTARSRCTNGRPVQPRPPELSMAIVESSRTTADSTIRRSEVGYACCQCTQRKRSRLSTVSTDNIETADCLGEGSSSSWARL
ncbi:hypothetical protein IAQ61_009506, partial [Plenodomus lingam]|uniref:uncharacterized protein n=1 Tax=Leptosphaeria maculans TaxID=5022 RepID=UPI00332B54EA